MEAPSVPSPSLSMKLSLLWETQKPLFIAIVALISLLFLGAIFCIVYFLVIKPGQAANDAYVPDSTDNNTATSNSTQTVQHLYHGMRTFLKLL